MFTPPGDLDESELRAALSAGWGFDAARLTYRPVGFGSHHWLATGPAGERRFVTVDDLTTKARYVGDDVGARLERAFETASSLREVAGLTFVVAPVRTVDGRVIRPVGGHFSVVVHPFVDGSCAGDDGEFRTYADRRAVLDLLVDLHRVPVGDTAVDDLRVPHRHELARDPGSGWGDGPYASRARDLAHRYAAGLARMLAAYDTLAARVAARPDRMVITHGEPHAGNVLVTPAGFVLVDWETVLSAPPERDLRDLGLTGAELRRDYPGAVDPDALTLYRLGYDLAEIGLYLGLFRAPHADTADAAESWRNLRRFLRPAERWPDLCR